MDSNNFFFILLQIIIHLWLLSISTRAFIQFFHLYPSFVACVTMITAGNWLIKILYSVHNDIWYLSHSLYLLFQLSRFDIRGKKGTKKNRGGKDTVCVNKFKMFTLTIEQIHNELNFLFKMSNVNTFIADLLISKHIFNRFITTWMTSYLRRIDNKLSSKKKFILTGAKILDVFSISLCLFFDFLFNCYENIMFAE